MVNPPFQFCFFNIDSFLRFNIYSIKEERTCFTRRYLLKRVGALIISHTLHPLGLRILHN